jgi:hypothetical protein
MKFSKKTSTFALAFSLTVFSGMVLAEKNDYLSLKNIELELEGKGENKTLDIEIHTQGPIPDDGKSGAFGYAALTDDTNNLLVFVTHLPIDDSSHENPDNGFHTHVLDLKKPSVACKGANFEVDLENSGKNSAFDADYNWKLEDSNKISIEKVPVTDLGNAGVESIVSFTLKPILDAHNKPTNLCITVVDQA